MIMMMMTTTYHDVDDHDDNNDIDGYDNDNEGIVCVRACSLRELSIRLQLISGP